MLAFLLYNPSNMLMLVTSDWNVCLRETERQKITVRATLFRASAGLFSPWEYFVVTDWLVSGNRLHPPNLSSAEFADPLWQTLRVAPFFRQERFS